MSRVGLNEILAAARGKSLITVEKMKTRMDTQDYKVLCVFLFTSGVACHSDECDDDDDVGQGDLKHLSGRSGGSV